jgi:hypothetical protein
MWCEQNRGAGVRPCSVVAQCCPRDAGGASRRWQRQSATGDIPWTEGAVYLSPKASAHTPVRLIPHRRSARGWCWTPCATHSAPSRWRTRRARRAPRGTAPTASSTPCRATRATWTRCAPATRPSRYALSWVERTASSDAKVANRDAKVCERGDREWSLNDGQNLKHSRRTCACEYGLQSCRGKSAGVAKRPRERSPTRNP